MVWRGKRKRGCFAQLLPDHRIPKMPSLINCLMKIIHVITGNQEGRVALFKAVNVARLLKNDLYHSIAALGKISRLYLVLKDYSREI